MKETFQNYQFDDQSSQKAKEMSRYIFTKLQENQCSLQDLLGRYKLVCQSYIIQNLNQGIFISNKSLWNSDLDGIIEQKYQGKDFIAIALVYYVYIE